MFEVFDWNDITMSVESELGQTPQGWSGLVVDLFEHIKQRSDERQIAYPKVKQLKEKFGELKIYFHEPVEDQTIQAWISGTIQEANRSCEVCGNSARVQIFAGRYQTLCCWCGHTAARRIYNGQKRRLFSTTAAQKRLTCSVCRHVGQVDRTDDHGRCPACITKGWRND